MAELFCPTFFMTGQCLIQLCPLNHTNCILCKERGLTPERLWSHFKSKKHKKRMKKYQNKSRWTCPTCNHTMSHADQVAHIRGKSHRLRVAECETNTSQKPQAASRDPAITECTLCDQDIPLVRWAEHLHDPVHLRKARLAVNQEALEATSRDKFGVCITQHELDFGIVDISTMEEWPTRENVLYIRLLDSEHAVLLKNIELTSQLKTQPRFRDSNFSVPFSAALTLLPGATYAVKVTFDPKGNRGRYEDRVEFTFQLPLQDNKEFVISRTLKATVTVMLHQQKLAPTAPYTRPKRRRRPDGFITDGELPLDFELAHKAFWYLPKFEIPPEILSIFQSQHTSIDDKVDLIRQERLLAPEYEDYWQTLLWLEEYQAAKDMELYDQVVVAFCTRSGHNYLVDVPGLGERRPPIIIGDSVVVRRLKSRSNEGFRAFVHAAQQDSIMIGSEPRFSRSRDRVDVGFELNRRTFRRMHRAVTSPCDHGPVLSPEVEDIEEGRLVRPATLDMNRIALYDERVGFNRPQMQAVTAIARLPPGTLPFVIFGPPGTGKTVTIVEAILQVLAWHSDAKILACASNNHSADIITGRLCNTLSTAQLFRLNAPSRVTTVLPGLESYSLQHDDGSFGIPEPEVLMQYWVVVTTCASGSLPHEVGVPNGHFTHIFIDEAGRASEPEVMIPIQMNANADTNIVLAGDPKQLGPIVRSPIARRLGLGVSYLDRLMAKDMYKSVANRGVIHVKLTKNWRSHQCIIEYPSQQFYDGELEACADPSVVERGLGWDKLPNPDYPIIFHAIKGQDLRESLSPSWFNIEEASAVLDYVRDLRYNQNTRFVNKEIGVITPYRAQVCKLRTLLHTDFPNVKVGTTEEFQGDERHAIIVSTVRSSLDFVDFDVRHTLGFVAHPRRFNVAMTRAKSLLIIVGDPDVLALDSLWRRFLNQIHANGGWKGQQIPWDPAAEVADGFSDDHLPSDAQLLVQSDLLARISEMGPDTLDEVERLEADADLYWYEDE